MVIYISNNSQNLLILIKHPAVTSSLLLGLRRCALGNPKMDWEYRYLYRNVIKKRNNYMILKVLMAMIIDFKSINGLTVMNIYDKLTQSIGIEPINVIQLK